MKFNSIFNILKNIGALGVIFSIKRQQEKIGEMALEEASFLAWKQDLP